ncbi:MAG: AMP-binding protein [Blastocatellia bacterium]|nr:AMP-binding protein [Blastocatellia bacterium]
MNAVHLTLDNLDRFGEYVSIWFEDRSYTNFERYDYACRLAAVLREHGVAAGDRIVVMMLNSPEVTAAFAAIWKIGAVIIPVTPMWTAREARYVLENSGARFVITSPELADRLTEASAGLPAFRAVLTLGAATPAGAIDIAPAIEAAPRFDAVIDRAPDDLALLLYTSGTTGNPKGVMLSHDNLLFIADSVYQLNAGLGQVRGMQVLPLSHIYGVLMMNLGARMGSSGRILRHFDARQVLQTIEELRVQRLSLVPTMLTLLINQYNIDDRRYDVSSLEAVGSGGAPLAEATRLEFERLFQCTVKQGYGLSESSGALTGYRPDEAYRHGSVGRPLPGVEMCVMDDARNILPPGQTGELCSRGRQVMQGYYSNPAATRDTIIEGWLHTGDVGCLDADGYVYITDRKKDLIIKGGENISPTEIEESIYAHPAIAEAAVIGVPDPVYGENLVAAVALKPGAQLTTEELLAHLEQRLTRFKLPASFVWLDALPKGSTGKILKRALRERLQREQ